MSEQLLTPWFPVTVKPVRKGEYEYRGFLLEFGPRMTWNGHQWGYLLDAYRPGSLVHLADEKGDEWRGLAEKP